MVRFLLYQGAEVSSLLHLSVQKVESEPAILLHKKIQLYDGLGGGYCITCAPASLRSTNHYSVQGCTKRKRYGGKCIAHCDKNNELYIAQKQKDKLKARVKKEAEKK